MTKKGLGRGLGALIPVTEKENLEEPKKDSSPNNKVLEIEIKKIKPNQYQPRTDFKREALEELAASIAEIGIVQPLVIRKGKSNDYELVAGERRLRASKLAGLSKVPCIIKDYDDLQTTEIALIENIQREDLNPLEEAGAYKLLLDEFNLTQEELAQKVAKSRPYITNLTRLLNLPDKIKDMLVDGLLTVGHARALLPLPEKGQLELAEKIQAENLTVREVEKLVKGLLLLKDEASAAEQKKVKKEISPEIYELEERLKGLFGTKVKIGLNPKKGKIEIDYYSLEDLNRIVEILMPDYE